MTDSDTQTDFFHDAYDREDIAYGLTPSGALAGFLEQFGTAGTALDLGAGAGRDTLALAKAGFDVHSVDISKRGIERIQERAQERGLSGRVSTSVADVRTLQIEAGSYDAIIATTVLDHIDATSAIQVWDRLCEGLTETGVLFVEVHTTEDPGSGVEPGQSSDYPVSETAGAVINYFSPNQLAGWAVEPASRLRILSYQERLEWDYTHGPEHLHGKAILLAVRQGHHPTWYGQPAAFPKQ